MSKLISNQKGESMENKKDQKVYIFLDKTLSNPQKIVQSTHLGIESNRHYPCDHHPSVVVLSVTSDQFEEIKKTLNKREIKSIDFYEPLFDKVTGIATEPITPNKGKYLQHFPMIKDKDFISENKSIVWHPPLPANFRSAPLSLEEEQLFEELIKNEE